MKATKDFSHVKSSLLNEEEHLKLFSLFGNGQRAVSTTVVEMWSVSRWGDYKWNFEDRGVLCLVRDSRVKSFFFRLYCLTRMCMIWEHELYKNMEYIALTPFLYTFEAEECVMGFNFANEAEGSTLRQVVLQKLQGIKRTQGDKSHFPGTLEKKPVHFDGISVNSLQNGRLVPTHVVDTKGKKLKKKKKGKNKLRKTDIGEPKNFKHLSHVQWNPNTGFDCTETDDPLVKEFFEKVGVTTKQLQDEKTRKFINNFISKNGGMEALKEAVSTPISPTPPQTITSDFVNDSGPPPPPFPPPPLPEGPPTTPPAMDAHAALMEAIKTGTNLKHVSGRRPNLQGNETIQSNKSLQEQPTSSSSQLQHVSRRRPNLQGNETIQSNKSLQEQPTSSSSQLQLEKNADSDLSGALARALAARSLAIQDQSSPSSESDYDDAEEWAP